MCVGGGRYVYLNTWVGGVGCKCVFVGLCVCVYVAGCLPRAAHDRARIITPLPKSRGGHSASGWTRKTIWNRIGIVCAALGYALHCGSCTGQPGPV